MKYRSLFVIGLLIISGVVVYFETAGQKGSDPWPCDYLFDTQIISGIQYYYSYRCSTGNLAFGSPTNAGGVSGTDASAVLSSSVACNPGQTTNTVAITSGVYTFSSSVKMIGTPCDGIWIEGIAGGSSIHLGNNIRLAFTISSGFAIDFSTRGNGGMIHIDNLQVEVQSLSSTNAVNKSGGIRVEGFEALIMHYVNVYGPTSLATYSVGVEAGNYGGIFWYEGLLSNFDIGVVSEWDTLLFHDAFTGIGSFGVLWGSTLYASPNSHSATLAQYDDTVLMSAATLPSGLAYTTAPYSGEGCGCRTAFRNRVVQNLNFFNPYTVGGGTTTQVGIDASPSSITGGGTASDVVYNYDTGGSMTYDLYDSGNGANFVTATGVINKVNWKTGALSFWRQSMAIASSSVTAGPSVWTYTNNDAYPEFMVLTNMNGLTNWTCNGAAMGTGTQGETCYLSPGQSLIATWATNAPVFRKMPS